MSGLERYTRRRTRLRAGSRGLIADANVVHAALNELVPLVRSGRLSVRGLARQFRSTDAVCFFNGRAYPRRASVTRDSARRVRWVGPTAPPVGDGYAVPGLDVWEETA